MTQGADDKESVTPSTSDSPSADTKIDTFAELQASAEAGDAEAMRKLGNRYKSGNGVKRDYAQMEQWWEKAAEAGDATAMWDLGYYSLIGKYLKKDTDKALKWFQAASDKGNADAAFELGFCYAHGQFLDQDLAAAEKWLQVAKSLGSTKASDELKTLVRKKAAKERHDERQRKLAQSGKSQDIVLDHISQSFGKKVVLDDISLTIKGGELIAFVGGSGGGKSTLINIIRKELKPTKGEVRFDGTLGFVPQQNLIHESLTIAQHLRFYATSVKRLPRDEQDERIETVMEELDLKRSENNIIGRCSGGEKRRLSVACELLARPTSLLLDEPTSGLDPGDSGDLIAVLRDLVISNDMTIVVINHDYENIKLFDKIVFLAKGKICFYGTPKRLFEYFDTTSSRDIYNLMRTNPDPFIRRFDEWLENNPTVSGGIQ